MSVATTLGMQDQMSSVLKGVITHLNMTLVAMEEVQHAMDRTFDSSNVQMVQTNIQQVESALGGIPSVLEEATREQEELNRVVEKTEDAFKSLPAPIEDAAKEQEELNQSFKDGQDHAADLLRTITNFVGAYVGYRAIKGFLTEAFHAANDQIRAEQRLLSIMSNINGMTQEGIKLVKQKAYELEQVTAISSAVGIFGQSQLAQYVYDPQNIVDLTQAMYDLATETYGVGVTQEQLMQTSNLMGKVMMGDINALSRNGFKIDAIFTEAEQKMLKYGTEAERAALVVQMIEENLDQLSQTMARTPEGAIQRLANAWGGVQTALGYGLIPIILLFVDLINENMPFIQDVFVNVFNTIFIILEQFFTYASIVFSFFVENWTALEPILLGLAVTLGILVMLLGLMTIKWTLLNTVMKANPFVLVVALIIGLIAALYHLWKTNDDVAAGVYRGWNAILNFFDTFPAYFWQLAEWILTPFSWWASTVGKIYDGVINSIIEGINTVLRLVNRITGSAYEIQARFNFEDIAGKALEFAGAKKDDAYVKAAEKAAEREQKVLDMLNEREAKRTLSEQEKDARFTMPELVGAGGLASGMWDIPDSSSLSELDRVGSVGRIEDKVDISSEDLKIMRELAEMKSIQNFVTLTPTVEVQTGDIRNESDIDMMILRIKSSLEEEIAESAKGVYSA